MLSNKTIDVIRICMKTMRGITQGETEGAKKARIDITNALIEFDNYINEIEDEQREFEENYNSYLED